MQSGTPLVIKVGYYKDPKSLEKLAKIANEYVNDIARNQHNAGGSC